jgi:hypothetical protein
VHQNFQYETSPIDNSKIVSPTQTLVSTNSQDKHLEPILRWWAFIAPSFFALNATNKINNAKINLGSDINYSFSGMLQYIFNDSFETNTVMEIKKISYLPITNFEIESPEYFFNLAVKTIYQYHSRLAAIATIQNQQLPILSTIIDDQIILTKFNAPVVSLGNRFSLLKTTKHLVNCEFNIGYQLPTVANNQEVESSFNYKLQFDLIFTRPNYLIGQTIYYTTKNDKTELFNQSHREIGFIFGVGF